MREGIFVVDADGHVKQKAKILGGNALGFYGFKA